MRDNLFLETLERVEKKNLNIRDQISLTKGHLEKGDIDSAYTQALRIEEESEKMTLLSRVLPAYTGNPHALKDVRRNIEQKIPVKVGFTEEGWLTVRMFALLPKKEKGSVDYIRASLCPAMDGFFRHRKPVKVENAILAFRHVYDKNRPERAWRDHDNIEVNMVSDIIAMYALPDDSPKYCSHFYCSAPGDEDRTEIFLVPWDQFEDWLYVASKMPEHGVRLYGRPQKWY